MPIGVYKHKPHSEETKLKISKTLKGIKLSEEHKRKISETHKKKGTRPPNTIKGIGGPNFKEVQKKAWLKNRGLKQSLETRMKKSLSVRGNKSYAWKGGITSENKTIRASIEFCLWREAVFSRDDWTCRCCGERGKILHSHHIKNFSQFKKLRFIIDNGITFCRKCHREFHKEYTTDNNNMKQVKEFLNKKNKINDCCRDKLKELADKVKKLTIYPTHKGGELIDKSEVLKLIKN